MGADPNQNRRTSVRGQQIAAMVVTIRKLEAELANMKAVVLTMSARMLRVELAISTLDKDGSLDDLLRPTPEKF